MQQADTRQEDNSNNDNKLDTEHDIGRDNIPTTTTATTRRRCELHCVSVCVREQLSTVGEDILCVLEKHGGGDRVLLNVRVFVLERLSVAAECICSLFQREVEALRRTLTDAHHHRVKDPRFDVPHQLPVCKEEVSSEPEEERSSRLDPGERSSCLLQEERSSRLDPEEPQPPQREERSCSGLLLQEERSSRLDREEPEPPQREERSCSGLLLQEERSSHLDQEEPEPPHQDFLLPICKEELSPGRQEQSHPAMIPPEEGSSPPPHIKEEPEELPACAAAEANVSTATLVKSEGSGGDNETEEPLACTSTQQLVTTQHADVEDREMSWPAASDDQPLSSSHRSESDTEDSDEWDAGEDRSPLKARNAGARLTLSSPASSPPPSQEEEPKSSTSSPRRSRHHRTGKKTVSCEVCGKTFSRNEHLNRHTKTHTGEKPYSCTVCGKAWGEKGDLTKHMRIHTGEKPFSCPFCRKGFGQVCDLKKHIRAHTGEKPYVCAVCGKGCSQMGDLKKHMMTHTGERPFDCAVCGKNFYLNQHLKRHMKIHEREKPSR